jgi:hypothetical protein
VGDQRQSPQPWCRDGCASSRLCRRCSGPSEQPGRPSRETGVRSGLRREVVGWEAAESSEGEPWQVYVVIEQRMGRLVGPSVEAVGMFVGTGAVGLVNWRRQRRSVAASGPEIAAGGQHAPQELHPCQRIERYAINPAAPSACRFTPFLSEASKTRTALAGFFGSVNSFCFIYLWTSSAGFQIIPGP